LTGVSFIVTVFDKVAYLPRVTASLARQTGDFSREFIFVDDGSNDGSAVLIERLTAGWPDPVHIVRQPNRGASTATNAGAARAKQPWLKLLDGDDLLLPGATALLLRAATETGQDLAYGDLATYRLDDPDPLTRDVDALPFTQEADGLAKFIRNCPANSSSILVAAERYRKAGGCDERLVSPDQALFLRLFATAGGTHVEGPVALVPEAAPGRLSGQKRRSRYESVLALYHLVTETPDLDPRHARLAYRRAFSRAARFHRAQGGSPISGHLWRLIASRFTNRIDPDAMYLALGAFTENGSTERPKAWLPGALRSPDAGRA
jgi:hypothetical protein